MSATLLQMVNRFRRKLKYEDVSSFSSSDDLTTAAIDCINEAKRDVLENHEWDFDIRSDGILKTIAPLTYTDQAFTTTPGEIGIFGSTDYAAITGGSSRSRIAITEDTSFGDTYFIINSSSHPATADRHVIETSWPGSTFDLVSLGNAAILTAEYVLPTTIRDVLTVKVEEVDTLVEFVDGASDLEQLVPNAFEETSDVPEVCFVGGSTTPTVATGTTATPGLGIWIYPVPASVYVVRYTYRYRHPALSATTDTLYVQDHIIDDIIDLALARAMRTRIAPDLENSAQLEGVTMARISRSAKRTGSQPLERMTLRSHDRRGGRTPMSGRPANPRVFYEP